MMDKTELEETETIDQFDFFTVDAKLFNVRAAYEATLTTEVDYGGGPRLPINRKHLKPFLDFERAHRQSQAYQDGEIKPVDLERLWFASDHHFGHRNIIKYANRPFGSVEEMDRTMVERHNELVAPGDTVVFGGDIAFASTARANELLNEMNGYKIFIIGNHDFERKSGKVRQYAVDEGHLWWRVPAPQQEFTMVFTHYPIDGLEPWVVNLHGHIHDKVSPNPLHVNLCVEHHEYAPVPYSEVERIARSRFEEAAG